MAAPVAPFVAIRYSKCLRFLRNTAFQKWDRIHASVCFLAGASSRHFPMALNGQTAIEACMVGMHLADDLGIWENYGQMQRDFQQLLLQRSHEG